MGTMRLACLLLGLAATGALAQEVSPEFDLLDANRDGYVTLAEAAGNPDVVAKFDRADRNRDGKLSAQEFARLPKINVRVARTQRERMRAAIARDAQAAAREPVAEAPSSAAAGGSARPDSR
jgi:Ca2+-binding EF-hand superfamily protein